MNADVDIRVERGVGNFFLQHLKDARQRLWIISPWLSVEYVSLVLEKVQAGVDVKVITSDDYIGGQKQAIRELLEKRTRVTRAENKTLKYLGIGISILGFLFGIAKYPWLLLFVLVGIFLYRFGREKIEDYWTSRIGTESLKILPHNQGLFHAKVYIADNWLVIGSANFTHGGLQYNAEAIAKMQSEELISSLSEIFTTQQPLGFIEIPYNIVGEDVDEEKLAPQRYYKKHWLRRRQR